MVFYSTGLWILNQAPVAINLCLRKSRGKYLLFCLSYIYTIVMSPLGTVAFFFINLALTTRG
jgi:hypothetical protein